MQRKRQIPSLRSILVPGQGHSDIQSPTGKIEKFSAKCWKGGSAQHGTLGCCCGVSVAGGSFLPDKIRGHLQYKIVFGICWNKRRNISIGLRDHLVVYWYQVLEVRSARFKALHASRHSLSFIFSVSLPASLSHLYPPSLSFSQIPLGSWLSPLSSTTRDSIKRVTKPLRAWWGL